MEPIFRVLGKSIYLNFQNYYNHFSHSWNFFFKRGLSWFLD